MSLIGAAIFPHNPLLVSTVGLQNQTYFKNTLKGIQKVVNYIESQEIDTIIIISAHNLILPDSFVINLCPQYKVNFTKFADLNTDFTVNTNTGFAYKLKESLETKLPVNLICESQLDYTFGVILFYLKDKLNKKSIIPIYCISKQNSKQTINFGEAIIKSLHKDNSKFFIIVSGDLSHQTNNKNNLPVVNKEYDYLLIKYLKQNNLNEIANIKNDLIINSHQCIHGPLMILNGVLKHINFICEIYSYENVHGVGLLTSVFKL